MTTKTTATKAHVGGVSTAAATVVLGFLAKLGVVPVAPETAELMSAWQIFIAAIVTGGVAWVGAYMPRNLPKAMVPLFAVLVLAACTASPDGTVYIDHDGDPDTPPIAMTKQQRCAWYNTRISMIEAKPPPLNEYDSYALTGYYAAAAIAGCAVAGTPPAPEAG